MGGICITELDGSSEKVYKIDTESSFALIGNYAYFAGDSVLKVDIKTGDKANIGNESGDYSGTFSVFNNQLL